MSVQLWRPPPRTIDDVRDPDGDYSYPTEHLDRCATALILFAAAFHGRQDAVHIEAAGMRGTCVDVDGERLEEMRRVYPTVWEFQQADAFAYAEIAYASGVSWDVVSLDPFTNLFDRCADRIELWCALANRLVVIGTGRFTVVEPPAGWKIADHRWRSDFQGGVFWTVLQPMNGVAA